MLFWPLLCRIIWRDFQFVQTLMKNKTTLKTKSKKQIETIRHCSEIAHTRYINILTWLRGFRVKIVDFKVSFVSQFPKETGYKENNTKYGLLSWKPRSHVRILIYRTWPIELVSMLLGNSFDKNRRPSIHCSAVKEMENLSYKDRKKLRFCFLCRWNLQLFVLYCKNWTRMAYFEKRIYEECPYNFTGIQHQYKWHFSYLIERVSCCVPDCPKGALDEEIL